MTIEILLNQFYTDLLLVKRDSEQTAITYKISAEEFLNWLVTEHIKLKDVSVQNLLYYIINIMRYEKIAVYLHWQRV